MGSPQQATPPWMSELVAKNRKVGRNMWASTDSYFNGSTSSEGDGDSSSTNASIIGSNGKTVSHSTTSNHRTKGGLIRQNQVIDPVLGSIGGGLSSLTEASSPGKGSSTSSTTKGRLGMASVVEEQMHLTNLKSSSRGTLNTASTTTTTTEKSSPIRDQESRFMDDVEFKGKHFLRNGEAEESILEYGPGIVRKLRSRYQSLALRQYSSRPSLRRSASLENVLDSLDSHSSSDAIGIGIGGGGRSVLISRESPSPTPFDENGVNHHRKGSDTDIDSFGGGSGDSTSATSYKKKMTKSTSASVILEPGTGEGNKNRKGAAPGIPTRGRANFTTEKRDRMRRARSVDALHRTKHEEEILEKFKAVVLPKEEIVIIEVSKPRANLGLGLGCGGGGNNNSTAYYLGTTTGGINDKPYPTQLFISPSKNSSGLLSGLTESQQLVGGIRTRSFISPEHELPPHDIVRETARIFEKNQENLSINGNKKVGQALRLSLTKSHSTSGSSSTIAQSPPPPSPTQPQQRGTVMAQGSPSMHQQQQQLAEMKRDKSPCLNSSSSTGTITSPTAKSNNTSSNNNNNANASSHAHGLKQVGIIRPTVSHPTLPLNLINGEKVAKHNETSNTSNRAPPTLLSPILSPSQNQAYKTLLQHSQKPPLSPKPIFTSSPKPVIITNNQKTIRSNSSPSESPIPATQSQLLHSNKPAPLLTPDKPLIIHRNKEISSPIVTNNNSIITNGSSINRARSPVKSPSPIQQDLSNNSSGGGIIFDKTAPSSVSSNFVPSPNKSEGNTSDGSDSVFDDSNNGSSKGRESPSSLNRNHYSGPLKQVANSFTIPSPKSTTNSFETSATITTPPASVQTKSTPQQVNGVVKIATRPVPEPRSNKTVSTKSEEPSRVSLKNVKAEVKAPSPLQKQPASSPSVSVPVKNKKDDSTSQLRTHQKQKSNQSGNSCMVFNFTNRSSVPDYIEDDGLHRGRITLAGTVTDESVDDVDSPSGDLKTLDIKSIKFEGANVIINGKSSIQKKPKSLKMNISFNESATTTYEYPSEVSLLAEDEANSEKDMCGHKTGPSVINSSGSGLGSYTPKLASSDYQLGNFVDSSPTTTANRKGDSSNKKDDNELIEDYLKPDSETTTWSNEIGADILF